MKLAPASIPLVRPASRPESRPLPRWELDTLAGRLGELSGLAATSRLSLAFGLLAEAQRRGEPAAWVTDRTSTFFPPDAAANGIALERLPVVFVPDAAAAARVADKLVRSGAFGLVVLDLVGGGDEAVRAASRDGRHGRNGWRDMPPALLSRLVGLAQQHETALLFLTDKSAEEPSLGGLVSLRCAAERHDAGAGRFFCSSRALKDKRRGPGWTFSEVRRGPVGLR